MTEILRILMLDAKVVIMDEPTAALTERETATLFNMMRKMKARGVAIVYISHRMEEVFSECDNHNGYARWSHHHYKTNG